MKFFNRKNVYITAFVFLLAVVAYFYFWQPENTQELTQDIRKEDQKIAEEIAKKETEANLSKQNIIAKIIKLMQNNQRHKNINYI